MKSPTLGGVIIGDLNSRGIVITFLGIKSTRS